MELLKRQVVNLALYLGFSLLWFHGVNEKMLLNGFILRFTIQLLPSYVDVS